MISAVDTNVLLDVLLPDPDHGPSSAAALRQAYDEGALLICDVVYAELASIFSERRELDAALGRLNVRTQSLGIDAAWLGGRAWRAYRQRGGPRQRVLPDFLIGAHAVLRANRLVTRDRGFFRQGFPDLVLLDPSR